MQTRTQRIYKKVPIPDITKLTGQVGYDISKCWLTYNPGSDEKATTWDASFNHHALWYRILNLLSKRGFKIEADKSVSKTIRRTHKYGIKSNGIEFCSDIYPNGFKIEFFQNVTKSENLHGGKYDFDKYKKMPYLLKLAVKAEFNTIIKLAKKFVKLENRETSKNSTEFILQNFRTSSFTRNKINSLDELDNYMSDYDRTVNSRSVGDTLLKNGETKYYYDYKGILKRGVIYHNINNMWWVIVNDTEFNNISSGNFFDFVPGTPLKKPLTKHGKVQRLHTELKKMEAVQNYERCIVLKKLLESEKLYRVWSKKWDKWWGPNNSGYTSDINQAGVYTHEQINTHRNYYDNKQTAEAIEIKKSN